MTSKKKQAKAGAPKKAIPWNTKRRAPLVFDGLGGATFDIRCDEPCVIVGSCGLQFHPREILLPHQLNVADALAMAEAESSRGEVWAIPVDTTRAVFIGTVQSLKRHARKTSLRKS